MDISSYLSSVSWGGGVGHGTRQVGGLLLCSGIQAGKLYATTYSSKQRWEVCGWWSMIVAWSQSMAWFVVSACSAAADVR